jgi:hypothetical protein
MLSSKVVVPDPSCQRRRQLRRKGILMSITDHSEPIGFDITLPLVCVSCCVYVSGCHGVYLYKHMNKNIPNEKRDSQQGGI